jgi:hypothetical protein
MNLPLAVQRIPAPKLFRHRFRHGVTIRTVPILAVTERRYKLGPHMAARLDKHDVRTAAFLDPQDDPEPGDYHPYPQVLSF